MKTSLAILTTLAAMAVGNAKELKTVHTANGQRVQLYTAAAIAKSTAPGSGTQTAILKQTARGHVFLYHRY